MDSSTGARRADAPAAGPPQDFIDRLRACDQRAWAELYDAHHTQIWRYAYARTGDRDTADDIAAQTFTEAVASIRRYRHTGAPILAWLYRITRNLVGKHARKLKRAPSPGRIELAGGAPEDRLDSLVLADVLRRLTREQREVIALRFVAGYSTREIAGMMAKRESAIYSLEVRAIAALRRHLTRDVENSSKQPDEKRPLPGIDRVR